MPGPRPGVAAACAAALAGGVLYALGYLGYGLWPCLLVFLTPLWWALDRLRARRLGPALAGFAFGLGAYAAGFRFLWHLLDPFLGGRAALGAALWVGYGLWFAAGFAAYGAVVALVRRRGWPLAAAAIPPLLVLEWLQLLVFPLYAGGALVLAPLWAQSADLGGPLLLTALLAGANVVAYETTAWRRGRRPRPRAVWAAALVVAAAVPLYGTRRVAAVDATVRAAPRLRVGIVQANLDTADRDTVGVRTHRRHLAETRALLDAAPLDLVVWPESAYVRGIRRPLPVSGRPILGDLAGRGVPLLFGGSSVVEVDGRRRRYNSALLVGADGTIRDAYDKNLLIPLAEVAPFAELVPGVARWFPEVQEFRAAATTPALRLGRWRLATPICYEAIRPEFVRRMVATARPHLLVTLANDAWFGASQEPWIHLQLARLRAIEHRRFLVRATNSGISAIVDPAGRLVARTGAQTRATLVGEVRPLAGTTVYARLGDWPGWLAAGLVVLTLATRPRRHPAARSA